MKLSTDCDERIHLMSALRGTGTLPPFFGEASEVVRLARDAFFEAHSLTQAGRDVVLGLDYKRRAFEVRTFFAAHRVVHPG